MSCSLYKSTQYMGQPTLWYTKPQGPKSFYELGHTLRRESHSRVKSTHELGHLIEWVAPWVRSVPTKTLDLLDLTM